MTIQPQPFIKKNEGYAVFYDGTNDTDIIDLVDGSYFGDAETPWVYTGRDGTTLRFEQDAPWGSEWSVPENSYLTFMWVGAGRSILAFVGVYPQFDFEYEYKFGEYEVAE